MHAAGTHGRATQAHLQPRVAKEEGEAAGGEGNVPHERVARIHVHVAPLPPDELHVGRGVVGRERRRPGGERRAGVGVVGCARRHGKHHARGLRGGAAARGERGVHEGVHEERKA